MKNNPLIPFILIMAFGIGLIFFMSLEGVGNNKEEAEGGEATTDEPTVDIASCTGCHGGDLTGGTGPSLVGVDADTIVDALVNGVEGSTMMIPGMKTEEEAKAIAEHITSNYK